MAHENQNRGYYPPHSGYYPHESSQEPGQHAYPGPQAGYAPSNSQHGPRYGQTQTPLPAGYHQTLPYTPSSASLQPVGTPPNPVFPQTPPSGIYSQAPQSRGSSTQLPSIRSFHNPEQTTLPPPHHPSPHHSVYADPHSRPPFPAREWRPPTDSPFSQHPLPPLRPPGPIRSNTHESFVGCDGFPNAMPSRGPKARFTPEEDALLKRLKEDYTNPKLSWKQIADFFPDRKSGTLQVRYCTKLRKKDDFSWSTELVGHNLSCALSQLTPKHQDSQLKQAAQEVEADKWRQISVKLNNRISAQQCQERLETLEAEDLKRQGNEEYEIAGQ